MALRAIAGMDLDAEEMRHAVTLAENITSVGGIDFRKLPEDTRRVFTPILAEWLNRNE